MASVGIFVIFRDIHFSSLVINILAKHVLGIHLLEWFVSAILAQFIKLSAYINKWYFFIWITLYVIILMIICIIFDTIRAYFHNKVFKQFDSNIKKVGCWIKERKCIEYILKEGKS